MILISMLRLPRRRNFMTRDTMERYSTLRNTQENYAMLISNSHPTSYSSVISCLSRHHTTVCCFITDWVLVKLARQSVLPKRCATIISKWVLQTELLLWRPRMFKITSNYNYLMSENYH